MKRIALILLILALMAPSALGEVDLSGFSFDELVALKDQINLAIWNSEEWQEVTVPQGRWIVGEDIPAGKWTIKCANVDLHSYAMQKCDILWGSMLDSDGEISFKGRHDYVTIYNPDHEDYSPGEITHYDVEFLDGDIVEIDLENAPAVFTPYAGKPDLGFK